MGPVYCVFFGFTLSANGSAASNFSIVPFGFFTADQSWVASSVKPSRFATVPTTSARKAWAQSMACKATSGATASNRWTKLSRQIYQGLEPFVAGDGHFWLQYGSLELLYGDLDFAENFLLQAAALMHGDDLVETALGHLYLRRAGRAASLEEALRLRDRGDTSLQPLVAKRGSYDPVVYHVRGSQLLGWVRSWGAFLSRSEVQDDLRAIHKFVRQGLDRHPRNPELRQLEGDLRRELLTTAVPQEDNPRR